MGEFCEFDIDFEQFDDLRAVVVHDECGAHEDVWFYRLDGLKAENAKLRELVLDMWPHVRHRSRMCGECELPCDTSEECLLYEPMRQSMRELGIEVDG